MKKKAIVIGAGVIGLTSAIKLQEKGWVVKIIAENITPNVTSDGPAAIWEPFLSSPEEKVFQWAKLALEDFQFLQKTDTDAGVVPVSGYDFGEESSPNGYKFFKKPKWMTELVKHRDLHTDEVPKGWNSGAYFETYIVNMKLFMPWLMKTFKKNGGSIQISKVCDISYLIHKNDKDDDNFQPDLIVNCTGLGAKELVNDKEVYPIRGQVVKIEAPWIKQFYFASDTNDDYIYILPRDDSITLGGTAHKNEWNTTVNAETSKNILERCERLVPNISKSKILSEWVGLRPGRSTIRLEEEYLSSPQNRNSDNNNNNNYKNENQNQKGIYVIHNYGHGGSGITLSWGCAREVANLAEKLISDKKVTTATIIQSKL